MNFHIFVLCTTVVFYIVLRSYKSQISNTNTNKFTFTKKIENDKSKPRQSNLIYVLFVPAILYLVKFVYGVNNTPQITTLGSRSSYGNSSNTSVSERLLTMPYPDSSINVSSTA